MKLEEIKAEDLEKHVVSLDEGYALFEAEILQDNDYDLKAESLENELPEALSASELIDEVDSYTIDTKIWEDTPFEDFKNIGPILSQFHSGSKLIEKYLSHWGDWHAGVFIDAISEESLVRHLRSLLLVNLGTEGEVHYRLQETRKLAGVLESMDSKERISELLGPIKSIAWQKICGADKSYFIVENPNPHETNQEMGWFNFSQAEEQKINAASAAWYKRSIVSTVQDKIEKDPESIKHLTKYKPEEIEKFLDNGYESAQKKNIQTEEGLRFFLINSLYYPEFMNGKEAARIVNQDLWLEPKKINLLKEMLESYLLETQQLENTKQKTA